MSQEAQREHNSQQTSASLNAIPKLPAEPFISNVLAHLGLDNNYALEAASLTSLLSALRHSEWQARASASRKLGKLGERAGLEPLVAILMQDSVAAVRASAARALGELDQYDLVEPLIAALDDPADYVKEAAAWALGELGAKMTTSTPLECLLNCNNSTVRASAIRALGKRMTQTSTSIFLVALEDPDWLVREMAALMLEKQRDLTTH